MDGPNTESLAFSSSVERAKRQREISQPIYPCNSPIGHRSLQRRLVAIFYADVDGYSRLTEEDEEGTHRILSAYLDAISVAIARHRGKIDHFAGDAVLAHFDTPEDALMCAMYIQHRLKAKNASLSNDSKLQFRIGINLADVIVDRKDIYGYGVNVAARLQRLAKPSGICISEAVYHAVGNKLPLIYECMGARSMKNIGQPVRAFQVRMELRHRSCQNNKNAANAVRTPNHRSSCGSCNTTYLFCGSSRFTRYFVENQERRHAAYHRD